MKILVIGGMHGNEQLGLELVRSLQENPIEGIDTLIANPRAVEENVRFIETDLNRSFGVQETQSYETERAKYVAMTAKKYDLVLDFHNTQTPENNCAFVGVDAPKLLYEVAAELGYQQVIQATYDCVNKYCLNTISMEISVGDAWDDVSVWRDKLRKLAAGRQTQREPIAVYRFLQRVTWEESKTLKDSSTWKPFEDISEADKKQLGISGEVVPIFIGSHFTEYYATLLKRIFSDSSFDYRHCLVN